jgi:hypothetical protein
VEEKDEDLVVYRCYSAGVRSHLESAVYSERTQRMAPSHKYVAGSHGLSYHQRQSWTVSRPQQGFPL